MNLYKVLHDEFIFKIMLWLFKFDDNEETEGWGLKVEEFSYEDFRIII